MKPKSINGRGKQSSNGPRLAWCQAFSGTHEEIDRVADKGFLRVVDIAPECITINQDGCIVYANQAAADQLGANDLSEIIGRKGLDFVTPAYRQVVAERIRRLHEEGGQSELARFQRIRLDGQVLDLEAVAVEILWRGRPAILSMVRDITARLRAEERLQGFLATATDLLWETDAAHRFTYVSNLNKGDITSIELLGKTRWESAGVAADCDEQWRAHIAVLEARRPFSGFEYQSNTAHWRGQYRSVSGRPIFDSHGVFRGYRGTSCNVTDRKQAQWTIERMARHDALTNLPNRAQFEDELKRICSAAQRDGTKSAVMFLDLDHFKDVNDALGHSIGDELLVEVANRLRACVRRSDLVARFGGDEFVIVLDQPCDVVSVGLLAGRITKAIGAPCCIDGRTVHTGVSIGVAIYPDDGGDTERIVANADLALYAAKEAGRQTWRIFDHQLQDRLQVQQSLNLELRQALDREEFELHYQPVVNLSDDQVRGFEALVRWNHPTRGQLPPSEFIPAAEQSQLSIPLTEWILGKAITQLQHWASTGLDHCRIGVNVPPILLKIRGFVELIDRCVAKACCDPRKLVVEITEGALIEEAMAIPILTALRERGVIIAVDDFGVGYSSMARLRTLPVDVLKLDRSFLSSVPHDANDASIVEALVNVGRSLGKKVVAEGVETLEQRRFLERIGCDLVQGFLVSRPMAAADVPNWFEQRHSSPLYRVRELDS